MQYPREKKQDETNQRRIDFGIERKNKENQGPEKEEQRRAGSTQACRLVSSADKGRTSAKENKEASKTNSEKALPYREERRKCRHHTLYLVHAGDPLLLFRCERAPSRRGVSLLIQQ